MQQGRHEQSYQESKRCKVSATSAVMAISIPCLYTKQKTKKRKTFNDGFLRVVESNGHCSLYSSSENLVSSKEESLDSQFLLTAAAKKILQGEYTEIEFESYFVTVERIVKAFNTTTDGPKAVISFKIPKFKPPSYTAPPQKLLVDQQDAENLNNNPSGQAMIMNGAKRGSYNVAEKELDDLWGEDEVRDRREGSISNSNSGDDNIGVSVYKVINSKTNDDFNRNQSYRNSNHDNPNDERNENFGRNNGLRDDKLDRGISHSRGDANYTEGSNGRYSRDCTRENFNNDDIHHSSSSSNIVGSSRGAHLSNRGFESGHDEDRDGAPLWEREKPSLSSNSRNHSIKGDSYISNGRNFNSNNMWGDDDSEVGHPVDNTWSAGSDRQLPLTSEGVIVSDNLWGDSDEIWGIPEVQNTRQLTSHESISIPQFVPEKGIPYTPSAFLWDGAAQPERGRITRSDDKQVDAPINSTRRGNSNNSYHSSATEDNMDYGGRGPSLDSGVHYHSADKRVRFEEEESASVRKECPSVDYNYARSSSNTSYSNFESQSSSPPLDGSLFCALPSTSPSDDGNLQCSTTFGGPLGTFFTSTDRQEDSDEEDRSDNNSSPGRESSNVNISRWGVDDDAALSLNSISRDRQNDSSSVVVKEVENSSSVWDF